MVSTEAVTQYPVEHWILTPLYITDIFFSTFFSLEGGWRSSSVTHDWRMIDSWSVIFLPDFIGLLHQDLCGRLNVLGSITANCATQFWGANNSVTFFVTCFDWRYLKGYHSTWHINMRMQLRLFNDCVIACIRSSNKVEIKKNAWFY